MCQALDETRERACFLRAAGGGWGGWGSKLREKGAGREHIPLGEWRLEVEEGLEPRVGWLPEEAAAKTELEAKEIYRRTYLDKDKRRGCRTGQGNPSGHVSALTSMGREVKDSGERRLAGLSRPTSTGVKISRRGAPFGPSQPSPSDLVVLPRAGGFPTRQWSLLQLLQDLQL